MIQTHTNREDTIITKIVEPQAKGETAQSVFETKKSIFRFNQVVWFLLGFVEVLLVFRFALKMLGANPYVGFTNFIYTITTPLTNPFIGIFQTSTSGESIFEWSTIIAAFVYLCIAWGFVYLMDLIYPITPSDVSTQ